MSNPDPLKSLFREDVRGWLAPLKKMDAVEAMTRVGLSLHQIEFVQAVSDAGKISPSEAVREMRLLSAERLAAVLALSTGIPWLPWTQVPNVEVDAEQLVPYQVEQDVDGVIVSVPIQLGTNGDVWYAISNPVDARQARLVQKSHAHFVIVTPKTLSSLHYGHFDEPRKHVIEDTRGGRWRQALGWLLTEAVYLGFGGVENIYFEPGPVSGQVFVQVEGIRRLLHAFELNRTSTGALEGVYGRLINLIASDIVAKENAISSPGALTNMIPANLHGRFDFRVEVKETIWGRAAVLRPFDLQADVADIDLLGLDDYTRSRMRAATEAPYGLVMVVGPTSSGKNTSAISMLYATDPLARSIQTVEHPVEVRVAAWEQHQIPPTATDAGELESLSRTITDSLLRSAPQVIYWGEVRNADGLARAISAANTGHLTMTTYHAGDIASAILRMRAERTRAGDRVDMTSIGELLIGVLAQRLLRKLCPACSVPETRDFVLAYLRRAGLPTDTAKRSHAGGCHRCGGTGYTGRVLTYEWYEPHGDVDLSVAKPSVIRSAIKEDLYHCGLRRIAESVTDYEEVCRVLRARESDTDERPVLSAGERSHASDPGPVGEAATAVSGLSGVSALSLDGDASRVEYRAHHNA